MGVGRIPEGKQPLKGIHLLALGIHPYGLRSLDMCFSNFGDSSLGLRTRNLGICLRGTDPCSVVTGIELTEVLVVVMLWSGERLSKGSGETTIQSGFVSCLGRTAIGKALSVGGFVPIG